ncbi:MAG: hypothetical protein CMB79_04620 [Filomicrobium sp.]|nr:hypothetical protein [Filomicrobium sp.]
MHPRRPSELIPKLISSPVPWLFGWRFLRHHTNATKSIYMAKRSGKHKNKQKRDRAKEAVEAAEAAAKRAMAKGKNPAAAMLGHYGGKKSGQVRLKAIGTDGMAEKGSTGGFARAASLSASERREIARKAAKARWQKKKDAQNGDPNKQ